MSNGGTNGLATAVALAGGIGEAAEDVEQVELFEPSDAALPVAPVERGKSGPKGGRPSGARNKSTEEFRQYFLSRYRSPLIGLAEIYSRSADSLARELQLVHVVTRLAPGQEAIETYHNDDGRVTGYLVYDRLKAFDRQMTAMGAAMPYLHQKQPIAITGDMKHAGLIVIGDLQGLQDAGDGNLTLELVPNQTEQNQQLSDDASVRLPDETSHDDAKSVKQIGDFVDDV